MRVEVFWNYSILGSCAPVLLGLNRLSGVLLVAIVVVFCLLEGVDVPIIAEPGKVFAYLCWTFVEDNAMGLLRSERIEEGYILVKFTNSNPGIGLPAKSFLDTRVFKGISLLFFCPLEQGRREYPSIS